MSHSHERRQEGPASPPPPVASSSSSAIPIALQHSPSPPPMRRTSSHSSSSSQQQQRYHKRSHHESGPSSEPSSSVRRTSTDVTQQQQHPMKRQKSQAFPQTSTVSRPPSSPEGVQSEALRKKEHIRKLAQGLATRLQYAAFKVERGWTKHSLPEVENLYWRASKGGSSRSGGRSAAAPQATRHRGSTATTTTASTLLYPPTASQSRTNDSEDVFGSVATRPSSPPPLPQPRSAIMNSHGLPTPPPSAGTDLSLTSASMNKRPSSSAALLRASPTRQVQAVVGAGKTASVGSGYADFWSKLGGNGTAGGTPPVANARKRPRESEAGS